MANRVCSSLSSSSSNWACLSDDLLGSLIDKLTDDNLTNYFRFSAVCKSWNSVALNHKAKLIPLQLPWLLTTSNWGDSINGEPKPCFYNFSMSFEISNVKLVCNFKPHMCRGSSHGWLVLMEEELTLTVLNPLSGKTIRLPPLTDPLVRSWESFSRERKSHEVVEKVILSRDPCLGCFEVLAICSNSEGYKIVAHLKYGDESWSYSGTNVFVKVAFYKDLIFGVSHDGIVTSLNIDPSSKVIKIIMDVSLKPRCYWRWLSDFDLVENTNGDLLMVHRLLDPFNEVLFKYKIHKLMIDSNGGIELIPIVDLGGDSLFLGDYHSISISPSKYSKIKPNCVYNMWLSDLLRCHLWIIEFNFEDGSSELKYANSCHKNLLTWFMPSMKL